MKRDVPAAIAFENLNPARRQRLGRSQHIRRLRIPAQRNHRRMFQQQEHVADLPGFAQLDEFFLKTQAVGISKLPELDNRNHVAIEIIGLLPALSISGPTAAVSTFDVTNANQTP